MKIRKVKNPAINISDNVENIITKLKGVWGEKKITLGTVHILLKDCMELVDKLNCPGQDKKNYVITIIRSVIVDLIEDPEQERIILELIDKDILGNTMDLIISATRGQLNLKNKKTQKKIMGCCQSFIPILINGIVQIVKLTNKKHEISTETTTETTTETPNPPPPSPENNERV